MKGFTYEPVNPALNTLSVPQKIDPAVAVLVSLAEENSPRRPIPNTTKTRDEIPGKPDDREPRLSRSALLRGPTP
jgi:hypothetical protein